MLRQDDENVVVSRNWLKSVLDSMDRATRAASHAGKIAGQAREAFDNEAQRLSDLCIEARRMLDRI